MIRALLAACLLVALPTVAFAQEDSAAIEEAGYNRASQIQYVMLGTMKAEDVFAPAFLAAIPESQLKAIVAGLVAQNGKFLSVDELKYRGDGALMLDLVFERARASAAVQLSDEAPYLVTGFRITEVRPMDDTPQKILADFDALPGNAGFGIYSIEGSTLHSALTDKATQQFPIGSAFKLWVLSALSQEIKAGKRKWSDVVPLDARSVPMGKLRDWPQGAPLTLHTLASLMISESDNTATDVLMHLLGRNAISAEVVASGHSEPARTLPLLTTLEAFALKSGDPARIPAYVAADEAGRTALLDRWAPTEDQVDFTKLAGPKANAIDTIEWFGSAEDISRILVRLRDLGDPAVSGILAINPGLTRQEADRWAYMGFKGGSEIGVLNTSWLLQDSQGHWFTVVASWNNPDGGIETAPLLAIVKRMIGMLRQ